MSDEAVSAIEQKMFDLGFFVEPGDAAAVLEVAKPYLACKRPHVHCARCEDD